MLEAETALVESLAYLLAWRLLCWALRLVLWLWLLLWLLTVSEWPEVFCFLYCLLGEDGDFLWALGWPASIGEDSEDWFEVVGDDVDLVGEELVEKLALDSFSLCDECFLDFDSIVWVMSKIN
jgi:hypothetical protein